ncbi:hypothetical protein B0T13DRAFT_529038, partial [Neurospora crassa]
FKRYSPLVGTPRRSRPVHFNGPATARRARATPFRFALPRFTMLGQIGWDGSRSWLVCRSRACMMGMWCGSGDHKLRCLVAASSTGMYGSARLVSCRFASLGPGWIQGRGGGPNTSKGAISQSRHAKPVHFSRSSSPLTRTLHGVHDDLLLPPDPERRRNGCFHLASRAAPRSVTRMPSPTSAQQTWVL